MNSLVHSALTGSIPGAADVNASRYRLKLELIEIVRLFAEEIGAAERGNRHARRPRLMNAKGHFLNRIVETVYPDAVGTEPEAKSPQPNNKGGETNG